MATSDFRPEVEIRQFRTCALKNDSVGHNGLSYGQIPGFTERISMVYSCVGNQSLIVMYQCNTRQIRSLFACFKALRYTIQFYTQILRDFLVLFVR